MNLKEQDKFIKSIETLFNQKCDYIFHDMAEDWLHIDVLYLGPTEKFPFNKLITMGESDFKMPKKNYLGIKRNEYMIFYDKNIDVLKNKDDFEFFMNALFLPGICVRDQNEFIEPYHEVTSDFENSNMVSSLLIFPQVMKKTSEIVIKLGTFKKCMCLQVMPINQVESEYGDQYGRDKLVRDFFYKGKTLSESIYLAEKYRNTIVPEELKK